VPDHKTDSPTHHVHILFWLQSAFAVLEWPLQNCFSKRLRELCRRRELNLRAERELCEMSVPLPQHVTLPPRDVVGSDPYRQLCWDYLHSTLAVLPVTVDIDVMLTSVCQGAFEIRIDGIAAVYDYSDYLLVDGAQKDYRHWFRFHYTQGYVPHDNLASFPPISFLDWEEFHEISSRLHYEASSDTILHSQSYEFLAGSLSLRDHDLYSRRQLVRNRLLVEFGSLVQTDRLSQRDFWQAACHSLVSVHVPGSWRHSLDRGQHQLLGLGVCTLSPEIWTTVLDKRIEAYQHYVPVRDDFSDLIPQVQWCRDHRAECAAMGRRAKAFFLEHSTPAAIWSFIAQRMHAGSVMS
jgi:hypothetical protein